MQFQEPSGLQDPVRVPELEEPEGEAGAVEETTG
jgi:hypothetical protein